MFKSNISGVSSNNVLVIGDMMLDHYIYGDCNRISPEAPVPIVEVRSDQYELGGAGNVVKNLSAFGYNPSIICVVGDDDNAIIVSSKLSEYCLEWNGLIVDTMSITTVKTRILVNKHQLIRLDREIAKPIDPKFED